MSQTPDGLEQRLLARARAAGFGRGDRIIVGFSGGRDSLVLAAALRRARAVLGIEPVLIHVDHRLRPSSSTEARQALMLAAALDLPAESHRLQEPPAATHPGVGLEEAARRERYRLLFLVAREAGARAVATAHHQADQAETVLLHLLRGAGVGGAAGMGELASASFGFMHDISLEARHPNLLWRPLLHETRDSIDRYLRRLGLSPIDDPSNDDVTLRRNALRHEILPALERHVPGATAALARYAMLAAEDDRCLDELALAALHEATDEEGRLVASSVASEPLALQRRMVRNWLHGVTGSILLSADRTDALLALARMPVGGKSIEVGEGWSVRRERGTLVAARIADELAGRER